MTRLLNRQLQQKLPQAGTEDLDSLGLCLFRQLIELLSMESEQSLISIPQASAGG